VLIHFALGLHCWSGCRAQCPPGCSPPPGPLRGHGARRPRRAPPSPTSTRSPSSSD